MPAISSRAIAVLAVLLSAMRAAPVRSQGARADESAIRAARARSNRAIAAHDVAGTVAPLLPEYVSVSSGNARSVGRDAAIASYAQIFADRPGVVFIRTPRAITVNAAWGQAGEHGRWTGRWQGEDGLVRVRGEYFAKWKKLDGHWHLLAEIFVQAACAGGRYCDAPPAGATGAPAITH